MAETGIEERLAHHIANLSARSLDGPVQAAFDRLLFDYIACSLAGFGDGQCRRAAQTFALLGGNEESSVVGLRRGVPAPSAAFAQGVFAHWFDWDDTHDDTHVHGGAVIFPVAIALAESRVGRGAACAPEDWFAAVVAAYDIACRIGGFLKQHAPRGWMPTGSGATIGAAAAGARIRGLPAAGILSAMGIAAANCGLSRQALADKVNAKGTLAGIAAKTATEAVLLAEAGVEGPTHFLTGIYGLHGLHAHGRGDVENVLERLGAAFSIAEVSVKPYPCCRSTHAVIDAVLALRASQPALVGQITSIEARVPTGVFERCGAPFAITNDARLDAQFSIPYTAALALRRGKLALDDFSPAVVQTTAAELGELIRSVRVERLPNIAGDSLVPVEVEFRSVRNVATLAINQVKGAPGCPLTPGEHHEKLTFAAGSMMSERVLAAIAAQVSKVRGEGPIGVFRFVVANAHLPGLH